jgi:hypothetical protein
MKMDAFGLLGFAHLLGAIALGLAGSEPLLVWSQFVGGLVEIAFAVYFYSEAA